MLTGSMIAALGRLDVEQAPLQCHLLFCRSADLVEVIGVFVQGGGVRKKHFAGLGVIAPAAPLRLIEGQNIQHGSPDLPVGGPNFANQWSARLRSTSEGVHFALDALL